MPESLALKYRPKRFEDLVGQRGTAVVLSRMVASGSVPQSMLLSGPSGTGKTSTARILVDALGVTDVAELDAASHGGVDDIRGLLKLVSFASIGGRALIIDEAQSITPQGFEALLQVLESPPPMTWFILTTTDTVKFPETVLSRLIEFPFSFITPANIHERLIQVVQEEKATIDDAVLGVIADNTNGNMRQALHDLDRALRARITTEAQYRALFLPPDSTVSLVRQLVLGDVAQAFHELDVLLHSSFPSRIVSNLIRCFRDLVVLKAGGSLQTTDSHLLELKDLVARVDAESLLRSMKLLWELRTKLWVGEDPTGNLEMCVSLLTEVMHPQVVTGVPVNPSVQEEPKLSLDEMRRVQ